MNADDQTRQEIPVAQPPRRMGPRLREIARRGLARIARPYTRQRVREAGMAATVERLQAELEHVGERHTEQIERLEELVRELILTAESLRRRLPTDEDGGQR